MELEDGGIPGHYLIHSRSHPAHPARANLESVARERQYKGHPDEGVSLACNNTRKFPGLESSG